MERIKLSLTEKRKIENTFSIFPEDYFDIEGLRSFDDIQAVKNHAFERLKLFRDRAADLYINGGMIIETLAAVQAAVRLGMDLHLFHWDREWGIYRMQTVRWKPGNIEGREPEEICLFEGRHFGMPEKSIFGKLPSEMMFDFEWQEEQARQVLLGSRQKMLELYVSGFTPACISVLNAAFDLQIGVTAMHYDNMAEEYFAQDMEVW